MTKLTDKLALLNTLRAAAGKPALKSWKASMADLDQRIADLTPGQHLVRPTSTPVSPDLAAAIEASDVKPTIVATTAPELTKQAKRTAVIKQIADKSVKANVPTTVIDAKAAGRQLRKATKKTAPKKVATKTTTKAPRATSTNEFAAYLATIDMLPKVARAKLRRANIATVNGRYEVTPELKKALTSDARKK